MSQEDILKAAQLLKQGQIVAFPTETVYGLGGDATNEKACAKIFELKNRPQINPLIVHVSNKDQAMLLAEFNEDAKKLSILWPGPLTMVLPIKRPTKIAQIVTAGLETIAIRVPSHSVAQNLLLTARCPIAAPSANPSGYISATTASHIQHDFGDKIFTLQNKEKGFYGLESTIIDLSLSIPTILRFGFMTKEAIEKVLGKNIEVTKGLMEIKAPGMMEKHYSPTACVRLNANKIENGEIGLAFDANSFSQQDHIDENACETSDRGAFILTLSRSGNLAEAASNLYLMLRELDIYAQKHNIQNIAVAPIPNIGIGIAINDRLSRAAVSTMI